MVLAGVTRTTDFLEYTGKIPTTCHISSHLFHQVRATTPITAQSCHGRAPVHPSSLAQGRPFSSACSSSIASQPTHTLINSQYPVIPSPNCASEIRIFMSHLLYLHTYSLLDRSLLTCNRFCSFMTSSTVWLQSLGLLALAVCLLQPCFFNIPRQYSDICLFSSQKICGLYHQLIFSLSSKLVVYRRHHLTSDGAGPRNLIWLLLLKGYFKASSAVMPRANIRGRSCKGAKPC